MPSSSVSRTSDNAPRIVEVMGATVNRTQFPDDGVSRQNDNEDAR